MADVTRRAALASLALIAAAPAPTLAWDFRFPSIEEGTLDLADLRGRVLLVVNTASYCGYTPQYTQLEAGQHSGLIFRDVHVEQEHLALALACPRFGQRGPAVPQRLHLGAFQHDAGLERLLDGVIVARLAVLRSDAVRNQAGLLDCLGVGQTGSPS